MSKQPRKQKEQKGQTILQIVMSSLRRRISSDELLDEQWLKFKDQMQKDDEIWYFKTPPETWTGFPLCGLEGYALVRDNDLVDTIILSMS